MTTHHPSPPDALLKLAHNTTAPSPELNAAIADWLACPPDGDWWPRFSHDFDVIAGLLTRRGWGWAVRSNGTAEVSGRDLQALVTRIAVRPAYPALALTCAWLRAAAVWPFPAADTHDLFGRPLPKVKP